jgi:XTP/dITP diphosphohydrolase
MELVFATNNKHKLEEVQSVMGDGIILKTLAEIGCQEDIPETGQTFEANAAQKSQYLLDHYRLDCFADDSGLEVYALNGEPGVISARYSGSRDMEQNMDLLLQKMEEQTDRRACFRTIISLRLQGEHYLFEGKVEGQLLHARTGSKGFGYDPLFVPDGYDRSFAEMDMKEKTAISHRTRAVGKMAEFLRSL